MISQAANKQLDLFVKTIHTDLGPFGNRTDVIVVDEGTVRGTSLLNCTDPAVQYTGDSHAQRDLNDLDS